MSVLIDTQVLTRTVRIGWANKAGTAICMHRDGYEFLVTAAHLVRGAAPGDRVAVRHKGKWEYVVISGIRFSESADVSVIVPATRWGEGLSLQMLDGHGLMIGEQVAFCGFPLGMEMEGLPDFNGWPTALVKSAIFSGAVELDGERIMLFDAINNVGFSGGPIVRRSPLDNKLYIVGLVSAYKYDEPQPVLEKQEGGTYEPTASFVVRPNSGFMYAVSSKRIKELIEEVFGRRSEPPRVYRRLPFLRRWSNEQVQDKTELFAGGA